MYTTYVQHSSRYEVYTEENRVQNLHNLQYYTVYMNCLHVLHKGEAPPLREAMDLEMRS